MQQLIVTSPLNFQLQEPSLSKETKQFTYKDGSQFVFMDLVDNSLFTQIVSEMLVIIIHLALCFFKFFSWYWLLDVSFILDSFQGNFGIENITLSLY